MSEIEIPDKIKIDEEFLKKIGIFTEAKADISQDQSNQFNDNEIQSIKDILKDKEPISADSEVDKGDHLTVNNIHKLLQATVTGITQEGKKYLENLQLKWLDKNFNEETENNSSEITIGDFFDKDNRALRNTANGIDNLCFLTTAIQMMASNPAIRKEIKKKYDEYNAIAKDLLEFTEKQKDYNILKFFYHTIALLLGPGHKSTNKDDIEGMEYDKSNHENIHLNLSEFLGVVYKISTMNDSHEIFNKFGDVLSPEKASLHTYHPIPNKNQELHMFHDSSEKLFHEKNIYRSLPETNMFIQNHNDALYSDYEKNQIKNELIHTERRIPIIINENSMISFYNCNEHTSTLLKKEAEYNFQNSLVKNVYTLNEESQKKEGLVKDTDLIQKKQYLSSFVNFQGLHYINYVRTADNVWLKIDSIGGQKIVSPQEVGEAFNEGAVYMLYQDEEALKKELENRKNRFSKIFTDIENKESEFAKNKITPIVRELEKNRFKNSKLASKGIKKSTTFFILRIK